MYFYCETKFDYEFSWFILLDICESVKICGIFVSAHLTGFPAMRSNCLTNHSAGHARNDELVDVIKRSLWYHLITLVFVVRSIQRCSCDRTSMQLIHSNLLLLFRISWFIGIADGEYSSKKKFNKVKLSFGTECHTDKVLHEFFRFFRNKPFQINAYWFLRKNAFLSANNS